MTEHSVGVDDAGGVSDRKTSTTVAMDFGRIALPGDLWLYLFGTPGQDRFHFMWDDLITGAIGAVVLVDTERLEQCFDAVDYFEARQIPFVLAVNCFDGVAKHDLDAVREALAVRPEVPVFYTDARNRAGDQAGADHPGHPRHVPDAGLTRPPRRRPRVRSTAPRSRARRQRRGPRVVDSTREREPPHRVAGWRSAYCWPRTTRCCGRGSSA